ncbi:MAG: radical SAM protein [Candidatus Bathyarchaeia archaeon]
MTWFLTRPDALRVLKDHKLRRALGRYFDVFQDKKWAKFMIAKRIEAPFNGSEDLEDLWNLHEEATAKYFETEELLDSGRLRLEDLPKPHRSYLDLKAEIAHRILQSCHFCERRCMVNRQRDELGFCQCGATFLLSSAFHHLGEEPELVPSGTIFSIGCNLTCIHCQNWTISQRFEAGDSLTSRKLAQLIESLRKSGARNINMVGGSPTPWLHAWIEAFRYVETNVPTVWNSNSYYSPETARLLTGFIDVYLLDYKYGSNLCAEAISSAPGYVEVCQRNHLLALKSGELIIRILLLPEHLDCCAKPIIEWIAKNLGPWVRVNIMDQYRPHWRAYERAELRRPLRAEEYSEALSFARSLGLENLA